MSNPILPKKLADAAWTLVRFARGSIDHDYGTFCPVPSAPNTLAPSCKVCRAIEVTEAHLRDSAAEARSN